MFFTDVDQISLADTKSFRRYHGTICLNAGTTKRSRRTEVTTKCSERNERGWQEEYFLQLLTTGACGV